MPSTTSGATTATVDVTAKISAMIAKPRAGEMGPSGSDRKNPSAPRVVAWTVAKNRPGHAESGRSQGTMAMTPDVPARSRAHPAQSPRPHQAQMTAAGTSTESTDSSSVACWAGRGVRTRGMPLQHGRRVPLEPPASQCNVGARPAKLPRETRMSSILPPKRIEVTVAKRLSPHVA